MLQKVWIESAKFFEYLIKEPLPPVPPMKQFKKKNPEFPELSRYDVDPGDEFWNQLPVNPIPPKPATRVNFEELGKIAEELHYEKHDLLENVISDLRDGAHTMVNGVGLKETNCGPSSKALIHGERTLDAVISWQKKGFLAGPFKLPPFKKLKVSSLIAVEKPNGDIRPCVNLSGPKGSSYNDGIKESEVDKMWPMHNATARAVAWCILACGRNAELEKGDQEAAYKNVPIKLDQLPRAS